MDNKICLETTKDQWEWKLGQHSQFTPTDRSAFFCQAEDDGRYLFSQHSSDQAFEIVFITPFESPRLQKLMPEQQDTCKTAIRALLDTAGKKNWDGEGADPVTENTVSVALEVVEELPIAGGIPEISADPEGSVEFNWHLDNGTMLTISIGQTGDIAISGLCDGEAKLTGMQWDSKGKIKSLLRCGLGWLSEMQER